MRLREFGALVDPLATALSIVAIAISATTAWLTYFRKGTIKATRPTIIYFGADGGRRPSPKVFLRTLLFSTSKRGRVIESMHVTLTRSETRQNFNVWVYGDDRLVRGSGLFVGETGISANHHFLTPVDASFSFVEGVYDLRLMAKLLGDRHSITLIEEKLVVTRELASSLTSEDAGLYFDWGPDSNQYLPHIDKRPIIEPPLNPFEGIKPMSLGPRPGLGHP